MPQGASAAPLRARCPVQSGQRAQSRAGTARALLGGQRGWKGPAYPGYTIIAVTLANPVTPVIPATLSTLATSTIPSSQ